MAEHALGKGEVGSSILIGGMLSKDEFFDADKRAAEDCKAKCSNYFPLPEILTLTHVSATLVASQYLFVVMLERLKTILGIIASRPKRT